MGETRKTNRRSGRSNAGAQTQLPGNIVPMGEIGPEDVQVYLRQDVYQALETFAQADLKHSRGMILLGSYQEEGDGLSVLVSACVEAKYALNADFGLSFTQETWDYVQEVRETQYPDKWIVGWMLSQPGQGGELSDYGQRVHANYFPHPFQLAYVTDPTAEVRGFYQWKMGNLEPLSGFYIYEEAKKAVRTVPEEETVAEAVQEPAAQAPARRSRLTGVGVVIAVLLALAALCYCIVVRQSVERQNRALAEQSSRQAQLEAQLASGTQAAPSTEVAELRDTISDMRQQLDTQQDTITRQQQTIDELLAGAATQTPLASEPPVNTPTPAPTPSEEPYQLYTVKNGDTLARICLNLGLNYATQRDEIMKLNNMTNENLIFVGQTYKFPKA